MSTDLIIRFLEPADILPIARAFHELGWDKPVSLYQRYYEEQQHDERPVFVAFQQATFCGYVTVCWTSHYPPFQTANIPEIVDFNVLPPFRRQGIGTRLLDEAESCIARRSPVAGIGVGLYADYGAAQRLYARRGYIPDGRGLIAHGSAVRPGTPVLVDDDLVLYLTKKLAAGGR